MLKKVIARKGMDLFGNLDGRTFTGGLGIISVPWPKLFLFAALLAAVAGALFATKTVANIDKNLALAKEEARPANINLIKITVPDCKNCFAIDDAVAVLKKQNLSVGQERTLTYDSEEGKSLVKKFGIKRLPAYLATGEINKKSIENFLKSSGEIKGETFVFTLAPLVFFDAETKKEVGGVTVTYLTDPSCVACMDPKLRLQALSESFGMKVVNEKELLWNSEEGQQIINKYNIVKLPTFILSADVDFYTGVKDTWPQLGTIESDKTYVNRTLFFPYRDLDQGRVLGLVDVIYLTDQTCTDCYDPEMTFQESFKRFYGVSFATTRKVDAGSAEGKSLIGNYKITKLPTILLSPEADRYTYLKDNWSINGNIEQDGWYIFRETQKLGGAVYKDLVSNQVVRPPAPVANQ